MACPAAGGLRLAAKVVAHHIRGNVGSGFEVKGDEVYGVAVQFGEPLRLVSARVVICLRCV